ncbi:hypothetical protein [Sporosarcina sp. FA9]
MNERIKENLIAELNSYGIYETLKKEKLATLDIHGLSRLLAVRKEVAS